MKEVKRLRVDIWELYGLSKDQLKELITDDALIWFHCRGNKCDEIHIEMTEDKIKLLKEFDKQIKVSNV